MSSTCWSLTSEQQDVTSPACYSQIIRHGLTAGPGYDGCQDRQLHAFSEEAHGAVGKETIGSAGVFTVDVLVVGRSPVDGKRHIKQIQGIDPLAIIPLCVLRNHYGVRGPISDHGNRNGLVVQQGAVGWVVVAE